MRHPLPTAALTLALLAAGALPAAAATGGGGASLTVLVDGAERPEYPARGSLYVEALRGREYALRITNPFPYRVAVALSVDGLNTIDARHTDPASARKWVLEPYGSAVVEGWQVNDRQARRFFFTGERGSYGAFLGKTEDLGVIEAVFFRERPRWYAHPGVTRDDARPAPREKSSQEKGRLESAPAAPSAGSSARSMAPEAKLSDEYAATGMGDRTDHGVVRVDVDLEKRPFAKIRLRYEFRPQLVELGVLQPEWRPRPIERREKARGFDGYCPEPGR